MEVRTIRHAQGLRYAIIETDRREMSVWLDDDKTVTQSLQQSAQEMRQRAARLLDCAEFIEQASELVRAREMRTEQFRRTSENAHGITTGASRARQTAELCHLRRGWHLYGPALGQLCHLLDSGGALDAPSYLPGGCCTSNEWTDGNGNALPFQLEISREV